MVFERKVAPVPEHAFLKKASAVRQSGGVGAGRAQTIKILKEAMIDQETKYKQMLEAKDSEIIHH